MCEAAKRAFLHTGHFQRAGPDGVGLAAGLAEGPFWELFVLRRVVVGWDLFTVNDNVFVCVFRGWDGSIDCSSAPEFRCNVLPAMLLNGNEAGCVPSFLRRCL